MIKTNGKTKNFILGININITYILYKTFIFSQSYIFNKACIINKAKKNLSFIFIFIYNKKKYYIDQ